MQLNISCHHFELTDAIKQHAENKLEKIKNHFDHLININMILEVEKNEQIAEATIHISGNDIFAKASSDDMYSSIDQMVNKLDTQVIKHKEKIKNHRG
jgi:putative sigma-54 modulation protein